MSSVYFVVCSLIVTDYYYYLEFYGGHEMNRNGDTPFFKSVTIQRQLYYSYIKIYQDNANAKETLKQTLYNSLASVVLYARTSFLREGL